MTNPKQDGNSSARLQTALNSEQTVHPVNSDYSVGLGFSHLNGKYFPFFLTITSQIQGMTHYIYIYVNVYDQVKYSFDI